jgi:hypothetical protein
LIESSSVLLLPLDCVSINRCQSILNRSIFLRQTL